MNRTWLLLTIILLIGCSSDGKKSKYEAADNSSSGSNNSKDEKKEVPDWMKGSSDVEQKSVSTEGSKGNLPEDKTGGKTVAQIPQGNKSTNNKSPESGSQDSVAKGDVTKTQNNQNPVNGSGESTALMAKLMESYDKSVKYFQEQQSRKMTQEEFEVAKENYAKMIEEWLKIADQMVGMKLRPKDRLAVVSLKRMAHESLMNFGREEHEKKLYEFGETLKDDTNNDIKKIYQFIKLKKPFAKILRGETIDEKEFFTGFEKFVSFYRDDYEVYQIVEQWLNQMYPANRDYYVRAIGIAAKHFTQSLDTQVMARSDSLKDRLLAVNIGFDIAVANVLEEKPDASKGLLDAANRLLAQPKLSMNSLLQIIQAGHQLESAGAYGDAKKYFDQIAEATKSYSNPKIKETVKFFLDNAKKRYDLLGKPIKVEGMIPRIEKGEFVRKPIDFSSYRGKVVILFFWAAENPISYQIVNELDKFYLANKDKNLALIGINADRRMEVISQVMQHELMVRKREWTHLMPSTPKILGLDMAMAKRCGVDQLPLSFVIDQEGKVDSYRVFGLRLQDTVSRLLGKPVKEIYTRPAKKDAKKDAKKEDAKEGGSKKSNPDEAGEKDAPKKTDAPKKEESGAPKKNDLKEVDSESQPKKEESQDDKSEGVKPADSKKELPKQVEPKKEGSSKAESKKKDDGK